jgi:hypothetical protein
MTDEADHLETEYVFIDAQAYVREKLDWKSKSFRRIEELAENNQLRVLTTSITKREVRKKISEALTHARAAFEKYDVISKQLGISTDAAGGGANERLLTLFEEFLNRIKAVEIPLSNNLEKLFDDYFKRAPPFSDGKKSEFPDAAVVDALRTFAKTNFKTIYVVSGDSDLKNCCVEGSNLIHAPSLNEIISRATVTKKLHDDLLNFAANDLFLKQEVRRQVEDASVYVSELERFADQLEVQAYVNKVEDVKVTSLNVFSREANRTFVCEVEFEANGAVQLVIEAEGYHDDDNSQWVWIYPSAEVTFEYDPDANAFSCVSVQLLQVIDIDGSQLDALRKFR